MKIRPASESDLDAWLQMRLALWPSADAAEEIIEMRAYLERRERFVVVAEENGKLLGFLEASIRNYAEGCSGERVAYVEGWWVDEMARRRGIGGQLMEAAENWAREQGCEEIGSDTTLDKAPSLAAHLALGWEEVERCIHFRKTL